MNDALRGIFLELRPLFRSFERHCVLLADEPGRYHLGTQEVRAKDGYRTWFGGLEIRKRYVSVHLMPVYIHPELLAGISDGLRKKMQGKSCFNFSKSDPTLFRELEKLARAGFKRFKSDGRV